MKGRTIRLYLVDGVPTGILTAEIINWTGKVILAPRSQLADLAKREEVKRTGVYCLVGPDPEQPSRDQVYIGEGDNVLKRLTAHDKDESKEFWTRTAVIISKDDNITKAHGRFLESRLIALAQVAGRARVSNGSSPDVPPLPEPDVADMEFFLDQARMVLPVLSMTFLQPKPAFNVTSPEEAERSPRLVMKEGDKTAHAIEVDGEFVVMKGSPARKHTSDAWTSYRGQRDRLIEEGRLIDVGDPDHYEFAEDVALASPSAAAAIIAAGNRNGRWYWKVEESGQSYGDWQESRLANAESESQLPDDVRLD